MTLVSVVIVNWNGRSFLERCMPSLFESLKHVGGGTEVIVVDNGSTDGSVEFFEQNYPTVHLIRNIRNCGFSVANNQAFAAARGKYVATLNNDTEVDPNWLQRTITVLEGDRTVGSCATQMRFLHFPDVINSAGISVDVAGVPCDRLEGCSASVSETRPTEVFGPSAGAAVYRKEMLDGLGGFNENFFAYYEDVDIAWRAKRAGWHCIYVPDSIVYHSYSGTSRQGSSFKAFLLSRNRLWLLLRNASAHQLLRYLPRIVAYDLGVIVVTFIRQRSLAPLLGKVGALGKLPTVIKERSSLPFLALDEFDPPRRLRNILKGRRQRDRIAEQAA